MIYANPKTENADTRHGGPDYMCEMIIGYIWNFSAPLKGVTPLTPRLRYLRVFLSISDYFLRGVDCVFLGVSWLLFGRWSGVAWCCLVSFSFVGCHFVLFRVVSSRSAFLLTLWKCRGNRPGKIQRRFNGAAPINGAPEFLTVTRIYANRVRIIYF